MNIWQNLLGLLPKKQLPIETYSETSRQRVSRRGIEMLKEFEGLSLSIYKDIAGHPTIGIGHKLTPLELRTGMILLDGHLIHVRHGLTHSQANDLKKQDVRQFEDLISEVAKKPLNQNQFDALVSFVFNIGANAFLQSTLLKKLNQGRMADIPNEIKKWNKITLPNGEKIVSNGLKSRRNKEAALWSSQEEIVQPEPKLKAL